MANINISGMKFYAYHGCFDEEKVVGTYFEADCKLNVEVIGAAKEDDLQQTVNYQEVYKVLQHEMQQSSALLENVVYRMLCALMNTFSAVKSAEIELYKLNPPLGGPIRSVSVKMNTDELNISRNQQ
ncbi:MAG: dihydroneopterin aldolase [Bacteroidales bacterium]|nr:dihydroneopterin aldolase [Bacteroidales bacterium]